MYSFHGAKPPALHLINFLLFIWLKLLLTFFFLSFGQRCCLGKSQTAAAFSQSSFKRELQLSRFVRLGFCHRLGTRRSKERIGKRNEFVRQFRKTRWRLLAARRTSASPCSACRGLRTEPQLPPWFGSGASLPNGGFSHLKARRQTPDKISMRSANLEKQLRHKHRGRVYLEMR